MSVLIKGMEMPTNCWLCPLSVLLEKPREMLFCRIIKEEVLRNKVDGNCPLIEVPPHGEWIHRTGNRDECSNCSARYYQDLKEPFMNYCPNCGARMEN